MLDPDPHSACAPDPGGVMNADPRTRIRNTVFCNVFVCVWGEGVETNQPAVACELSLLPATGHPHTALLHNRNGLHHILLSSQKRLLFRAVAHSSHLKVRFLLVHYSTFPNIPVFQSLIC